MGCPAIPGIAATSGLGDAASEQQPRRRQHTQHLYSSRQHPAPKLGVNALTHGWQMGTGLVLWWRGGGVAGWQGGGVARTEDGCHVGGGG